MRSASVSTWPYMMVDVVGSPRACAVVTTSIHSAVVMRPGRDARAHAVVEDLGRRPGQRAEAGVLQLLEHAAERQPLCVRRVLHLLGRKRVDVQRGRRRLDARATRST